MTKGEEGMGGDAYLIGNKFESHAGCVKGGGLFGVADPEASVVETIEDANGRSFGGLFVINHI